MPDPCFDTLTLLLARRLEIIADREFYARDPAAHLEALKSVSEGIEAEREKLAPQLPPRLRHFLDQASYGKALDYLRAAE